MFKYLKKLKITKLRSINCDFILCTGLFDEHEDDLEYYKKLLKESCIKKKLICTNPDLTVHRGNVEELMRWISRKSF